MKPEDLAEALRLLFENFWIIRKEDPENYTFLRRHQVVLQKELRQRFGLNLIVRPQYIQLLKRPLHLEAWMGEVGLNTPFDYALFCCCMAYIEGLEAETPFMLDELLRDLDLMTPEEMQVDWTNYNHRKSLVRVVSKLGDLGIIEIIQGQADGFEQSEANQEILFVTTVQGRAFLARAPQSYTEYPTFADYWQDYQASLNLEGNQILYQRLMTEPLIRRTSENEETFIRLRKNHHHMQDYIETNTAFYLELYRDYAALTLEQRDLWQVFPSRKVIDEILIQLATVLREGNRQENPYGEIILSFDEWALFIKELQKNYQAYWSKEFTDMNEEQLSQALLKRGVEWLLFTLTPTQVIVQPVFGRLIAEMREEDGK
ncbi:TIGR02678 family protein [Enterococcus lemanii]|uniref:TIGR02678 family protein n=1 Tax=Enterococcus lemanii TaxID=1159752 RepID=A0ABV9MW11_9ENTE|nr:TIGR02678 family protein [Enterococcus lemanii]MBM7709834.1 uncharacterized protein (TIGR02678 family) [Enterococcus lemanii]